MIHPIYQDIDQADPLNLIPYRPLPQCLHIPALSHLPIPKHLPIVRIQEIIVRMAHDILPQGIQTVQDVR